MKGLRLVISNQVSKSHFIQGTSQSHRPQNRVFTGIEEPSTWSRWTVRTSKSCPTLISSFRFRRRATCEPHQEDEKDEFFQSKIEWLSPTTLRDDGRCVTDRSPREHSKEAIIYRPGDGFLRLVKRTRLCIQ